MSKKLSVAIMPGFTEGRWQTQRFRKRLVQRGYNVVTDTSSADIVIAHSGAYYLLSPLRAEQYLVIINPTYWPGKTLGERSHSMNMQLLTAMRPGNQPLYHATKTAHNLFYLVRHARTNLRIVARAHSDAYDLEHMVRHPQTILVRNAEDPWLTPDMDALFGINPQLRIETLSGGHDDCWQYPDRYIDLLPPPK